MGDEQNTVGHGLTYFLLRRVFSSDSLSGESAPLTLTVASSLPGGQWRWRKATKRSAFGLTE
jgi:hypothetical protein